MKRGLLFTNHFLASDHFDELYSLFDTAAEKCDVVLTRTTGGACVVPFEEHPAKDADFVIFWDKDVAAARRMVRHGVPVFKSPDAIRICDSKSETAEALLSAGLPTPRTLVAPMTYDTVGYTKDDFVERACAVLGLPLVVKECYGSFGEQVSLVSTVAEAKETVARIGCKPVLFQAFVASSFGTDIRVNIVGGEAVCAMRRTGKAGDFRSNIARGGVGEKYSLSKEEESLAIAAARAVGADFAGVELLLGESGPLVCEVNSNPHFAGTYRHTGINLALPILMHILKNI